MTNRDRVIDFVSEIYPKVICDDCLASRLNFSRRQAANKITRALSLSPDFEKIKRSCDYCFDIKLSINADSKIKKHTQQPGAAVKAKPPQSSIQKLGLKSLKEIGFQKVGLWVLNADQLSLQLIKNADLKPALYAFVSADEILYVGKTGRHLKRRLYHYSKPGPTQRTNVRLNGFLIDFLNEKRVIEIYAFGADNLSKVGAFVMDIPAALEDDIIRKTKPVWNVRRSK